MVNTTWMYVILWSFIVMIDDDDDQSDGHFPVIAQSSWAFGGCGDPQVAALHRRYMANDLG